MKRSLALAIAVLLPLEAGATSPPLSTSGFATPGVNNTNYPQAIGSPSAGVLTVAFVACLDNTNTANPTTTAPSGWTQAIERPGDNASAHFGDEEVIWKVASGSEGASVNVPISAAANFNCGGAYFQFTGFNAGHPIDCTDVAWADSSTYDPPDQSVTGGPLDVYVIAFAHSRGDQSYSSGSDLTTNAHSDAGGLNSGRSVAVSHGAYSAISSKNPGAFVIGGADRYGNAVTCVIYPAVSGSVIRNRHGRVGGPEVIR